MPGVPRVISIAESNITWEPSTGHNHNGINSRAPAIPPLYVFTLPVLPYDTISIGAGQTITRYENAFDNLDPQSVEAYTQFRLPVGGTLMSLRTRVVCNTCDATITVRRNGVDTALTISAPAGTSGQVAVSASVTVAADDLISIQLILTSAAGGHFSTHGGLVVFKPSS